MRLRIGVVGLLVGVLACADTAAAHEPTVTEYSTGLSLNGGPWGISEGPGEKLWFSENSFSQLGSITAGAGVVSELTGLSLVGDVRGIAKGPDGNLWVTEANAPGKIARISPAGSVTEWQAHPDPSYPVDITAGPDGNLWFVSQSPEFIGRITPYYHRALTRTPGRSRTSCASSRRCAGRTWILRSWTPSCRWRRTSTPSASARRPRSRCTPPELSSHRYRTHAGERETY